MSPLSLVSKKLNRVKFILSCVLLSAISCYAMHRFPNTEEDGSFCLFGVNISNPINNYQNDFNDTAFIYQDLPSLDELKEQREKEFQAIKKQEQEIEQSNQERARQHASCIEELTQHTSNRQTTKIEGEGGRYKYSAHRNNAITPQSLAPIYAIANSIGLEAPSAEQIVETYNELFPTTPFNTHQEIATSSSGKTLHIYQPLRKAHIDYMSGNISRSNYRKAQLNVIQSIANGDIIDINQAPLVRKLCAEFIQFINQAAAQECANRRMIREIKQEDAAFEIAHATSAHFSQEYSAQQNAIATLNNSTHAILEELNMTEPEAQEVAAPQISDLEDIEQTEAHEQANINNILQELTQLRADVNQILAQSRSQNSSTTINTNTEPSIDINVLRNKITTLYAQLANIDNRITNHCIDREWTISEIRTLINELLDLIRWTSGEVNRLDDRISRNWNNTINYNVALRDRLRDEVQALHRIGIAQNVGRMVSGGCLISAGSSIFEEFTPGSKGRAVSSCVITSGTFQLIEGAVGFICSIVGSELKR